MIIYGIHTSPFGACFIALKKDDVCSLLFLEKGGEGVAVKNLHKVWPQEEIKQNDTKTAGIVKKIFGQSKKEWSVDLLVQGTDFQLKVWEALLVIPEGEVSTYAEIARKIGSAKAVRAVGTACGANPIAYLIPCHRVLASDGGMGGYRWGIKRKKEMLKWEAKRG